MRTSSSPDSNQPQALLHQVERLDAYKSRVVHLAHHPCHRLEGAYLPGQVAQPVAFLFRQVVTVLPPVLPDAVVQRVRPVHQGRHGRGIVQRRGKRADQPFVLGLEVLGGRRRAGEEKQEADNQREEAETSADHGEPGKGV